MTEAQAVEVLEMIAQLRAMLELSTVAVVLGVAFVAGQLLHRWTRGL